MAIKEALVRRHGLDLRFVVPLVFTQIYVVLLVGKDRRHATHSVMYERRASMKRLSLAALLAILGIVILLAALIGLYSGEERCGSGHLSQVAPERRAPPDRAVANW